MDAAALLSHTHAPLLRLLSAEAGKHFEGLQAAARYKSLNLSNKQRRQLTHLDVAHNWARHVTAIRCEMLVEDIQSCITNVAGERQQRRTADESELHLSEEDERHRHQNQEAERQQRQGVELHEAQEPEQRHHPRQKAEWQQPQDEELHQSQELERQGDSTRSIMIVGDIRDSLTVEAHVSEQLGDIFDRIAASCGLDCGRLSFRSWKKGSGPRALLERDAILQNSDLLDGIYLERHFCKASDYRLVRRIRIYQRRSREQQRAWASYCSILLGGVRDPEKHGDAELEEFIASHKVP